MDILTYRIWEVCPNESPLAEWALIFIDKLRINIQLLPDELSKAMWALAIQSGQSCRSIAPEFMRVKSSPVNMENEPIGFSLAKLRSSEAKDVDKR